MRRVVRRQDDVVEHEREGKVEDVRWALDEVVQVEDAGRAM